MLVPLQTNHYCIANQISMAKRIRVIPLILLFLIVLLGVCKPSGIEKASASYTIDLPSQDTPLSSDTDGAILLPATDKTIVQVAHYKLTQEFLFILGLAFSILLIFKVDTFRKPLFTISYFDNTFCHLIAINAP